MKTSNVRKRIGSRAAAQRTGLNTIGLVPAPPAGVEARGVPQSLQRFLGNNPLVFPPVARVYLVWYATALKTTASPGFGVETIQANSAYRPSTTIAGQPNYFDQLKLVYNNFKVVSSSVSVTPLLFDGTNVSHKIVVWPTSDSSSPANIGQCSSMPGARTLVVNSAGSRVPDCTTMAATKTLLGSRIFDDSTSHTATADPSILWYWKVAYAPVGTTNAATVQLDVKLVQEVLCSNRLQLVDS